MGIRDHPTAPRSPWQNGHAERLIGSIRQECLDHIVVFCEAYLRGSLPATPATTTNSERICPWGRIRRAVDRCNGSASSLLGPSWAGCTINIVGCSFRQAQPDRPLQNPALHRVRARVPMTITGKIQKFVMREQTIEKLGLKAEKTA
jgi:integrase-like protein